MSASENSVPVGYGSIAGALLTLAEIIGGIVLLTVGKSPAEKEAGQLLLGIATPVTASTTIGGRMLQAAPAVKALEPGLPPALRALADEGLRLVEANPPTPDGPFVARSTVDKPDAEPGTTAPLPAA